MAIMHVAGLFPFMHIVALGVTSGTQEQTETRTLKVIRPSGHAHSLHQPSDQLAMLQVAAKQNKTDVVPGVVPGVVAGAVAGAAPILGAVRLFTDLARTTDGKKEDKITTTDNNLYGSSQTSCGSSQCGIDPPAIHALCVTLPKDFCDQTKQSDWCSAEAGSPHCVCLGAWSLYVKEGNTAPQLDCGAVPGSVLSDQYISSWKTWNGNEIEGQEVDGLRAIYDACNTGPSASVFQTGYCKFVTSSTALSEDQKADLSSHASCS